MSFSNIKREDSNPTPHPPKKKLGSLDMKWSLENFGMVTLNLSDGVFALWEIFSICQQITVTI